MAITRRDLIIAAGTVAVTCTAGLLAQPPRPLIGPSVFDYTALPAQKTDVGEIRNVARGPTATLEELEMHITTLRPGQRAHAPHRHPHEEMMFLKEGTLEATVNDQKIPMTTGSVLFVAPNDLHGLLNNGTTDATYFVLTWKTPKTGA